MDPKGIEGLFRAAQTAHRGLLVTSLALLVICFLPDNKGAYRSTLGALRVLERQFRSVDKTGFENEAMNIAVERALSDSIAYSTYMRFNALAVHTTGPDYAGLKRMLLSRRLVDLVEPDVGPGTQIKLFVPNLDSLTSILRNCSRFADVDVVHEGNDWSIVCRWEDNRGRMAKEEAICPSSLKVLPIDGVFDFSGVVADTTIWNSIRTRPIYDAIGYLVEKVDAGSDDSNPAPMGLAVARSQLWAWGPVLLLSWQVILLLHLRRIGGLETEPNARSLVPWIFLYDGRLASAAGNLSLLFLPLCAASGCTWLFWMSPVGKWGGLTLTLLVVVCGVLLLRWRERLSGSWDPMLRALRAVGVPLKAWGSRPPRRARWFDGQGKGGDQG